MENVTQTTGHQPVIVIVKAPKHQQREDKDHYKKSFPKKTILGLSGFLVAAGILSSLIQVALLLKYQHIVHLRWRLWISEFGQGIWCGIFSVIAGGVGITSAKKPSKRTITAHMVLSILSALMSIPHVTFDVFGIIFSAGYISCCYNGQYQNCDGYQNECNLLGGFTALFLINLLLALAAGIISIVISAYTCRAVCCRSSSFAAVSFNPSTSTAQPVPISDSEMATLVKAAQTATNKHQPQDDRVETPPPSYNTLPTAPKTFRPC